MGKAQRITVPEIVSRKGSGKKITSLTAYDYTFARLFDSAGIDVVLVGDSLGTVIQGHETTLPVTVEDIIYHSRAVARAVERSLVISDMPFLSFQVSTERAIDLAGRLIKEGGVQGVKVEGGIPIADTIARLVELDIPVMGHVGLTPQSVHRMGGYKVQGKSSALNQGKSLAPAGSRERVVQDAVAVAEAGAFAIVLECIPAELAAEITASVSVPTIGIGAGAECDGQVLVSYDMLGLNPEINLRFVKRYLEGGVLIEKAVRQFIDEVQNKSFPGEENIFSS